jgi:hypothetical protein
MPSCGHIEEWSKDIGRDKLVLVLRGDTVRNVDGISTTIAVS